MSKENKTLDKPQNGNDFIADVRRSFTVEDLRKAFEAGRTVSNYKGEWQETYSDDYTSEKYEKFEDWLKNYA